MTHVSNRPLRMANLGGAFIVGLGGVAASAFWMLVATLLVVLIFGNYSLASETARHLGMALFGLLYVGGPMVLLHWTRHWGEDHRLIALGIAAGSSLVVGLLYGFWWALVPFGLAVVLGAFVWEQKVSIRWLYALAGALGALAVGHYVFT